MNPLGTAFINPLSTAFINPQKHILTLSIGIFSEIYIQVKQDIVNFQLLGSVGTNNNIEHFQLLVSVFTTINPTRYVPSYS